MDFWFQVAYVGVVASILFAVPIIVVIGSMKNTPKGVPRYLPGDPQPLPVAKKPDADRLVPFREYPVEIDPMNFLPTTKQFFEYHGYKLKPSAPVPDSWWSIEKDDPHTNELYLQFQHLKLQVNMHLQLHERPSGSVLEVGWSFRPASADPGFVEAIVSYAIDELRLALLAKAKALNPNLKTSGLQKRFTALSQNMTSANASTAGGPSRQTSQPRSRFTDPIVAKVYWPSPQDYNEAIQNPAGTFDSELLKQCRVELNALGLPRVASGAFASVYKVQSREKEYAIKCFLTLVHDQKDRYGLLSERILNDELDYTVDFEFLEKGILVQGKWYPILRMDWVTGIPLNLYVEEHLQNGARLEQLADEFALMMQALRASGIAHGDLQHGNILVTDAGMRLVDYDGMFVPGMEEMVSNEIGHRNYQHPSRGPLHFGPWLDNFSAWVIYLSLLSLSKDPAIWNQGGAGDECILLRQSDFRAPEDSALLNAMESHSHEWVRATASTIREALAMPLEQLPYLEKIV